MIRFYGPRGPRSPTGYQVPPIGAKSRGGIRQITNLDLYEISPVLHGANRYAGLLSIKSRQMFRCYFSPLKAQLERAREHRGQPDGRR
jgi:hypothetical protein